MIDARDSAPDRWGQTSVMRILLLEDNVRLADLVRDGLTRQGFAGDVSDSIDAAEQVLPINRYDSVSYTHLDVYKRQFGGCALALWEQRVANDVASHLP